MIDLLNIFDYQDKNLVRLGGGQTNPADTGIFADGGYVLDDLTIKQSDYCLTYGVSNDVSFEINYFNYTGKNSYTFDHTIDEEIFKEAASSFAYKNIFWKKEGLGSGENLNSLTEHLKILPQGNFLFKVDIEQHEYDFFKTDQFEKHCDRMSGIVIEFHWLKDQPFQNMFIDSMNKINKSFYLTHMHGNNCAGQFKYNNSILPEVIELSFINKKLVNGAKVVEYKYNENDLPNKGDAPEIIIKI